MDPPGFRGGDVNLDAYVLGDPTTFEIQPAHNAQIVIAQAMLNGLGDSRRRSTVCLRHRVIVAVKVDGYHHLTIAERSRAQ